MQYKYANSLTIGRDKDYVDLMINFTFDVVKAARIINLFPVFMKGCEPN